MKENGIVELYCFKGILYIYIVVLCVCVCVFMRVYLLIYNKI